MPLTVAVTYFYCMVYLGMIQTPIQLWGMCTTADIYHVIPPHTEAKWSCHVFLSDNNTCPRPGLNLALYHNINIKNKRLWVKMTYMITSLSNEIHVSMFDSHWIRTMWHVYRCMYMSENTQLKLKKTKYHLWPT